MKASKKEISSRARKVKLLLLDVDGVMTNGTLHYDGEGRETKSFHVWDGLAVRILKNTLGIPTAIVSGRGSISVIRRAEDLGIEEVHLQIKDKKASLETIMKKFSVRAEEICGVGDDIVDLPFLTRVGLPIAPANAHPEAKKAAVYVTKARGGDGAVRETVELILQSRGEWQKVLDRYCE